MVSKQLNQFIGQEHGSQNAHLARREYTAGYCGIRAYRRQGNDNQHSAITRRVFTPG
jgi:hypothetical protein